MSETTAYTDMQAPWTFGYGANDYDNSRLNTSIPSVKEQWTKIKSTINGNSNEEDNSLIVLLLKNLKQMMDEAQAREKAFFGTEDWATGFNELVGRLNDVYRQEPFFKELLRGENVGLPKGSPEDNSNVQKDINKFLSGISKTFKQKVTEALDDSDFKSTLAEAFVKKFKDAIPESEKTGPITLNFKALRNQKGSQNSNLFQDVGFKNRRLGKANIKIKFENKKPEIEAIDIDKMSTPTLRLMFEKLEVELPNEDADFNKKVSLAKQIYDNFSESIYTQKLKDLWFNELDKDQKKLDNYDVNTSLSSLKGFLAETATNALFNFLFDDSNFSQGTGNIRANLGFVKELGKGQSIGIDSLLKGVYGVQIKRLITAPWGNSGQRVISFANKGTTLQVPDFANRLTSTNLADVLITFFGVQAFNQPFNGEMEEPLKSQLGRYTSFYDKHFAYGDNKIGEYNLLKLLTPTIGDLIRTSEFATFDEKTVFGSAGEQLLTNTLFFINGQIFPTSIILQSIIQEVQAQVRQGPSPSSSLWYYDFESTRPSNNLTWSPEYAQRIKQIDEPITPPPTLIDAAKQVSIKYYIKMSFESILNRAWVNAQKAASKIASISS